MKNKLLVIALLVTFSTASFAALENKLKDTGDAVKVALVQFESDNDLDVINLYKGIRASVEVGGIAVKVYLEDGSKISYACHKHSSSDPFECHRSN